MGTISIFTALMQNAALLLAVAFVYDVLSSRRRLESWPLLMQLAVGGMLGVLGIIVMLSPWSHMPGIVFDTRSVLLSIAGLFFGVAPTAVAMVMTASFRLSQGGAATWAGIGVILTTGTIGIVWRHHRRRPLADLTGKELYLFGLVVHLDMLALMLTLPWPLAWHVLSRIALPVLTIYPVATALLGMLMVVRLRRESVDAELLASEERYRSLINNLPGLAYRCLNDEHWTMLFFSEGAEGLTGYPASDFIDNRVRSYASIIHPADRAMVDRIVQDGITARQPYELEYRLIRPDGAMSWVHEKGQGIFDPAGKLLWLDGVIIDITGQRQAQEEKERLQAQLLQAQKMESVGRLAGGVAHDFNNMLQTILGYCDLTINDLAAGSALRENIQEIRKAASRSAALTRQLLAFARKQVAIPRVLDLNDTVGGMLKMLQRLIGENIDLVWAPGHELWRVKIDPSQLDQILANLAVNARDAITNTGQITIATENHRLDAADCADHPDCLPGDYVLLAVSDSGCGMDQATLTHIFEPFFTTKEQDKGTGLGLATVYGIIRQNSGFVVVESATGQGTTFRIYLPRVAAEPADSPLLTSIVAAPVSGGTETVLLVEDEEGILKLGKAILELGGYTVLATPSTAEALRLAQEHPGRIHLLVTDVVMPEMNGRELAQHLMAHRPDLRCLYMSGYTADVLSQHGVSGKDKHFLQKPFSVREFTEAVRQALEGQP